MDEYMQYNWRITSIKYKASGLPRMDGRYPQRINSIIQFLHLDLDNVLVWDYISDNIGNPKVGRMRTSLVTGVNSNPDGDALVITTLNTVYHFEKVGRIT